MDIMTLTNDCWKPIIGKIAVFIMTFAGDEKYLNECLRYLEIQKDRYNFEIFILDDAKNPLENPPKNCHYWKTFFERQGNLNGQDCAHGMLIEMLKIARMSKAEFILKVDCDQCVRTFENFLSPLKETPKQVIGFKLNPRMCYCSGVTYVLPTEGLYKAVKDFRKWYKEQREKDVQGEFAPHCPEDWAISRCVADVNDYQMTRWDNSKEVSAEHWLMSPFNFEEVKKDGTISPLSFSRFQIYDFVNFGNRYTILNNDNPREFAANCMRQFADFDLENKF